MARKTNPYVVEKTEQIEALVSPFRHQLLRTLGTVGPISVRALGEHLGRSAESLYYHLRALEEVGLVVNQNAVDAEDSQAEAKYRTVSTMIVSDKTSTDGGYLAALAKSVSALLRLADRQFISALKRQADAQEQRSMSLRGQQLHVHLSVTDAQTLAGKLEDIMDFLVERDDPQGKEALSVTLISCPLEK
jgi:predicted transcriptional regulator